MGSGDRASSGSSCPVTTSRWFSSCVLHNFYFHAHVFTLSSRELLFQSYICLLGQVCVKVFDSKYHQNLGWSSLRPGPKPKCWSGDGGFVTHLVSEAKGLSWCNDGYYGCNCKLMGETEMSYIPKEE